MKVGPKEARLRAAREAPPPTEPAVPAKTKEKTMTKIDDTDNAPAPAGLADVPDLPTFLARPKPTKEERDALAAKAEREPRMPGAKIRSPRKRASAASKGLGASPSQLRAHGAKPGAKKKAAAKALDGLLAPARRAKGKRPEGKTKTEIAADLIRHPTGCTGAEVLAATGWPTVSMPAIAKATGIKLLREKKIGEPIRYRAG